MEGKNITIIVGSGSVTNSWNPVIRAIEKTYGISTNQDGANYIMAREVYLLRVYHTFAKRDHYPEVYEITKTNVNKLKLSIATELSSAQKIGEIESRPLLKEIVDRFTREGHDKIALVSTNWDDVIDNAINKLFSWGKHGKTRRIECYHLHGSIRTPDTIYLPSEITMENYRTNSEEQLNAINHRNFMSLLQNNNKTIIYGLSLSPLDAELNVSLASGWQSSLNEEIIIINPNHDLVAKRVKLLVDKNHSLKITGYDPKDLNKKYEYN